MKHGFIVEDNNIASYLADYMVVITASFAP